MLPRVASPPNGFAVLPPGRVQPALPTGTQGEEGKQHEIGVIPP